MLISAIMPIMSLYRLPLGQYGYSGHVINLPQDVSSFASSLPRLPAELDVIVVRKEGAAKSHRDFRVRRSVVLAALQWLVDNNKYYRNISIDHHAVAQLPEDGDLTGLHAMMLDTEVEEEEVSPTQDREDQYECHLTRTTVPIVVTARQTEQETIRQSVQDRQSQGPFAAPPVVQWPPVGGTPINEFNTEGYISCAFPTLFPTGATDFVAPRQHAITVGNYFKHLMMYKDGRFARHPRFRYFALNTEMRWRALQTGRIYVRQHPRDAQLTVDELRDMVGHQGEAFSNRVLHFASSLRGTRQYWFRQRSRLIAMVDTIGLPTVFFTHSAADLQWPELARLICPEDPDSSCSRRQALNANPAVADWFFHQRIQKFIEAFYVGVLGATDYWMRFEWQHRGSPHVHGVAWLPNAPDAEPIMESPDDHAAARDELLCHVDQVVCTVHPAVLPEAATKRSRATEHEEDDVHAAKRPCKTREDIIDSVELMVRHTRLRFSHAFSILFFLSI